jgi:glucosylglycerol-phosphate synthase
MDESIDQALDMSTEEQKQRIQKLYTAIKRYDVQQWANHLFREAQAAAERSSSGEPDSQEPALV